MVIQIAKDNSLKINQEDSSWDKLENRLVEVFKTRSDRVVFIKGDPDLEFATTLDPPLAVTVDRERARRWRLSCGQGVGGLRSKRSIRRPRNGTAANVKAILQQEISGVDEAALFRGEGIYDTVERSANI